MWAWGYEPKSQVRGEDEVVIDMIGADQEKTLDQAIDASFGGQAVPSFKDETGNFEADAIINGRGVCLNYFSLKAPSWGLSRISQRHRDIQRDYSYMSSAG